MHQLRTPPGIKPGGTTDGKPQLSNCLNVAPDPPGLNRRLGGPSRSTESLYKQPTPPGLSLRDMGGVGEWGGGYPSRKGLYLNGIGPGAPGGRGVFC